MAETSIAQEPQRVNYKSDFDFILPLLARSLVNPKAEPVPLGWPAHNWTAKFFTERNGAVFTASCIDGVCTNCYNDNDRIHVVCHRHGLSPGMLHVDFYEQLPDTIYPDGKRLESSPQELNIEIVRGPGDSATTFEAPIVLPYVMLRYADLTEEEKAELQSPATEAAKIAEAGELRRMANEQYRYTNEEARKTAEAQRQTNEGIRENKVNLWQSAEDERKLAEKRREDAEKNRETQEGRRVTEEEYRVRAENVRKENETIRQINETWRSSRFKELAGEMASAATLIETWKSYINTWSTNENTARANEVNRQKAEGERKSAEKARVNAESERAAAEEGREAAETERVETFATWQNEIDNKADRSELSNVLAEEPLTPDNFPDINTYTREQLKMDLFIDMWNEAWGEYGGYDPANAPDAEHPFMGNEMWFTYSEAIAIDRESSGANYLAEYCHSQSRLKTFYPVKNSLGSYGATSAYAFAGCINLEILRFKSSSYISISENTFYSCPKLRKILGGPLVGAGGNALNLPSLQEVQIRLLAKNLNLSLVSGLSLASLQYMVANAANTTPITITLHPDAYARATDELFAAASAKQITIASA